MSHQYGSARTEREALYGRQTLLECLRARRRRIHAVWVAGGVRPAGTAADILKLASKQGVPVRECEKRDLDRMTASGHHQGMVAEADPYPYADPETLWEAPAQGEPLFLLVLDHVQDPQNVGSLLRSADAAGVNGVLLAEDRAVGITPAVVRASSGASEHLAIARVGGLQQILTLLRGKGVWVYGLEGSPEAQLCTEVRMDGPVALVVGSEGTGLTKSVRGQCDALVRLPMRGRVASLNAAVAGALAMFEVRRQRDAKTAARPS